uniref:Epstein-Barr virus EBNA-1-like protein n=1 Tax=Oryza sativa subsp. japonica TaxID=39947 RepID=Q6ZG36_ORYSJ|nr:Epstein-Barr virus EBNA-1-like protein [Oryza sativa Japonica Group]
MGRPAQGSPNSRARGRRERESRWTGLTMRSPGWDPLVSGSAHRAEGVRGSCARAGEGRGARARFAVDADASGPRTASRLAVERAHGEGLTGVGSTRSRLSWRRRGAYVAATRAGGRKLDGGESRRRQPAGREEGNGDEVTRGRFPAVRASTRLRELDASVGLGGTTPSEAGDEWVLRSSGGDGGEHTASDGNGRGRRGRARSPLPRPRTHRLSRRLAMDGGGEAEHGSGDNGEEANGRGKEGRGKTGLKGRQCRFERGEPTWAVKPASWRSG